MDRFVVVCVPEARAEFGLGHVARQCVLTKTLVRYGFDACLVLPDARLSNRFEVDWLKTRIPMSRVLRCADVPELLENPSVRSLVVLDSYDYENTASTVGWGSNREAVIVLDDLAYERDYVSNVVSVIPNILSRHQEALVVGRPDAGGSAYYYGSHYVLIDSEFQLGAEARLALYAKRQRRLRACARGERSLILLMTFGGSVMALPNDQGKECIAELLHSVRQQFRATEVRCIGEGAVSLCEAIGQPAQSLGWLDAVKLRQTYLDSDVYFGSVGYSMWERASLLLPSFVRSISDNQAAYVETGNELGIHRDISIKSQINLLTDSFAMHRSTLAIRADAEGYLSLFNDLRMR